MKERENFKKYFLKKFWVIFWKISRIFLKNHRKIWGIFRKVSRNIAIILEKYFKNFENCEKFEKLFHKILNIISSMFENHLSKNFCIFGEILHTFWRSIISEYWKYFLNKVSNVLKIFLKMSTKYNVNFEIYFEKYYRNFWALFRKILKIIAKNLENKFMKSCESFRKFLKIISKKFQRFREILRTFARSISENFEKYFLK